MIERLRRLFRKSTDDEALKAAAATEERMVERLAKLSGTSTEEVRREARRRALQLEVQSMRRLR